MDSYDFVIVGAGFVGLCAAHTFLSINPSHTILIVDDKNTVGGVWAKEQLYPGLRSNNVQGYFEFSDFPMLEAGLGIKYRGILLGETIHAYLYKYAERFDLLRRMRLATKVIQATEVLDNSWTLELCGTNDESVKSRISCHKLVLATGQASIPVKLPFNGLGSFTKSAFHSVHLAKHAISLIQNEQVKEIVVIGGSKSGHDAVYLFAAAGKHVTWLIHPPGRGRKPAPMSKPYIQFGLWRAWAEGLILIRPLSWFGAAPWSKGDGFGWVRWFLHSTKIGNFLVKKYFEKTSMAAGIQSGILDHEKTKVLLPESSMLWYGTQLAVLNYDRDFYELVQSDRVTVIQGDIDYLDEGSVILRDKQSIHADALICAIGYDYSATVPLEPASHRLDWGCPVKHDEDTRYPSLDALADKEILAQFPILKESPKQPEREPRMTPWRLWRFIAPPSQVSSSRVRNLAFLNTISCFETPMKAEITSLWAYAYLHDLLAVKTPSEEEVHYEAALWARFGKWRVPYGAQGKLADFFHEAMPYFDLLLRDLGLRSWRKGWGLLGEVFGGRYEMQDYRGIVSEWIELQKKSLDKKRK